MGRVGKFRIAIETMGEEIDVRQQHEPAAARLLEGEDRQRRLEAGQVAHRDDKVHVIPDATTRHDLGEEAAIGMRAQQGTVGRTSRPGDFLGLVVPGLLGDPDLPLMQSQYEDEGQLCVQRGNLARSLVGAHREADPGCKLPKRQRLGVHPALAPMRWTAAGGTKSAPTVAVLALPLNALSPL